MMNSETTAHVATTEWLICETGFFKNTVWIFRGGNAEVNAAGALVLSNSSGIVKIYPAGKWKSFERNSPEALKRADKWATWNFW